MTKEELKTALERASENYETSKAEIYKEYARSNNNVNVGDRVIDHNGQISVETITWYKMLSLDESACVYRGPLLKKNGEKMKSGKHGARYQQNMTDHIKA